MIAFILCLPANIYRVLSTILTESWIHRPDSIYCTSLRSAVCTVELGRTPGKIMITSYIDIDARCGTA